MDCGTITKELAASIFFGHVKGAFTGADADKTGLFHDAEGGTLYFDEIGNLPIEAQQVLLRALQERQYKPLGGNKEYTCDVRIIAATNEDIEKAVDEGRFRFDLWQRVDEYTLEVPSLNECPEDVVPLAEELLKRFNAETHKNAEGFSDSAKEKLKSHSWPGNVRELKLAPSGTAARVFQSVAVQPGKTYTKKGRSAHPQRRRERQTQSRTSMGKVRTQP